MKPIRVFEAIARRRIIVFGLLCVLIIAGSLGFSWDLYRNSKRAKAVPTQKIMTNGEIIKQTDTTDYSNHNIIIPNGVTATIDGEHTFNNLTVQNGGVLTSTDYNNYGIYNPGNPSDSIFENLIGSGNAEYTFIVRGIINVGANPATWIFAPCSGDTASPAYTQPADMHPNDIVSVEFFNAIPNNTEEYDTSLWTGTAVGHGFASTDDVFEFFVDNETDAANLLLPFEMRYTNRGGAAQFGLCRSAAGPTIAANNYYLQTVDFNEGFGIDDPSTPADEDALTPEMKSITAFQGASQIPYTGAMDNYNSYSSYINNFKSGSGYNLSYFFQADRYDFANDTKISLVPGLNMLSGTRTFNTRLEQNQMEEYRRLKNPARSDYMTYHSNLDHAWNAPLASRRTTHTLPGGEVGWHNIQYFQPLLSSSLVNSLPIKVPTKLSILGTFRVDNGGKVNLNGRGFANTMLSNGSASEGNLPNEGSGPAGATYLGAGASHYGLGGASTWNGNQTSMGTYDHSQTIPPAFPGSGSVNWLARKFGFFIFTYWSFEGPFSHPYQYDYGNGGGYIYISANKIELQNGSMVMANGVGCDVDEAPAGASGGSIILADNNGSSFYNGLITAQGASTSDGGGSGLFGSDRTHNGGGGGGNIFISTSSFSSGLLAREEKDHYPTHDDPNIVKNPDWNYWSGLNMTTNSLSVMGGDSEDGGAGEKGIIVLKRNIKPNILMKKTLEPVNREGLGANFNPYGLIINDRIRVKIEVGNLSPNDVVSDDIPETKLGIPTVQCVPVLAPDPGAPNFGGVFNSATGKVNWTHSGTDTNRIFTYECVVKKL